MTKLATFLVNLGAYGGPEDMARRALAIWKSLRKPSLMPSPPG